MVWKIIKFIVDQLLEGKRTTEAKAMAAAKFNLTRSEVDRIWRNR